MNAQPTLLPASPHRWVIPTICALLCLALGTASGLLTASSIATWYAPLQKPPGTPPSWVFGPVWTALYLMMGVGLGRLILRKNTRAVSTFLAHFILNLAWTPVFFGAHLPWAALAIIVTMIFLLVLTIRQSLSDPHRDPIAAALITPTLIWVCYATWLNAGIAWLNR
jgi:tryptophan-rich sensory protein